MTSSEYFLAFNRQFASENIKNGEQNARIPVCYVLKITVAHFIIETFKSSYAQHELISQSLCIMHHFSHAELRAKLLSIPITH